MRSRLLRRIVVSVVLAALAGSMLVLGIAPAPPAGAAQPVPGHTGLVPGKPRTNTPPTTSG